LNGRKGVKGEEWVKRDERVEKGLKGKRGSERV
jgi:hypothetical protein